MLETIGIALFIMCVVFAVLIGIYFCVRIFSFITMKIEDNLGNDETKTNN